MKVHVIPLERLKEILEFLKNQTGHIGFITLYIPPDNPPLDVINYLRKEVEEARVLKSSDTRNRVISVYEFLITYLQGVKSFGPNGMVMFANAILPENDRFNEKMGTYVIPAPRPIPMFKFHIGTKFLLSPLEKSDLR